jgi:hypothetical protein
VSDASSADIDLDKIVDAVINEILSLFNFPVPNLDILDAFLGDLKGLAKNALGFVDKVRTIPQMDFAPARSAVDSSLTSH